jgi:hypothetical protein
MHERALRRRKKRVIRSSRMPLRLIRSTTSTNDPTTSNPDSNANTTNTQTRATPHRTTKRRRAGRRMMWSRSHAKSESKPERWRR